ncbi:MAG: hypothetical protein PUP92_04905 [Rhizonema sp. PD38]|nr:hypothetical protein [Rhizonema sp. PD38]
MSHPFELELSDLEAVDLSFEEQLTSEDAGKVHGGINATTNYVTAAEFAEAGEEGGGGYHPIPKPIPSETLTAVKWGESGEGGGGVITYAITAKFGEVGGEGGYL